MAQRNSGCTAACGACPAQGPAPWKGNIAWSPDSWGWKLVPAGDGSRGIPRGPSVCHVDGPLDGTLPWMMVAWCLAGPSPAILLTTLGVETPSLQLCPKHAFRKDCPPKTGRHH